MKKTWITLCVATALIATSANAAEKKKAKPAPKTPSASTTQATEDHSAHGSKKGLVDQVSGQGYGMAGCGLGSILFGQKQGPIQILAATFNGTAGNQTFGISSGTSNCEAGPRDERTASLFITANREALEKDVSRGNGESIATLSEIMGCKNHQLFGTTLQSNYGKIFPSEKASTDSVVDSIMNTVKADPQLSRNCG